MDTINKGVIGVCGPIFGIAIASSTVIVWLQIASLAGGIVVAGLSAFSIYLSIKRKLRNLRVERETEERMKHKNTSHADEEPTTTI